MNKKELLEKVDDSNLEASKRMQGELYNYERDLSERHRRRKMNFKRKPKNKRL